MTRNRLITSIATIAIIAATPAIAKPGGGGSGGSGKGDGIGGGMGRGPENAGTEVGLGRDRVGGTADVNTRIETNRNEATRIHGRGSAEASAGVETKGMGKIDLTGVVDGMTVVDSTGATVGTVTDISTKGNSGNVRSVEVTLSNGDVINVSPGNLSVDGEVLTTTTVESTAKSSNRRANSQGAANANINGLVHANPRSALGGAGVTTLTGLETGLTVNNSAAVAIGTVDQVFTNRAGAVVGIRVNLEGGGSVILPATSLTINGDIVTTTQAGL